MTEHKTLGKILKAEFGWGGYQEAMLGLTLHFTMQGSGVNFHRGGWGCDRSDYCKWTEDERLRDLGETVMFLGKILKDAKRDRVDQLAGTPVELTFEGNMLKDWRVLTEVL